MTTSPEVLTANDAACAIWRDVAPWEGQRTAAIGRFTCASAAGGSALLENACARLAGEGFGAVLGPMDGDTWHSYRLVTESSGRPAFFLEPANPAHFVGAFAGAGFAPVAAYVSLIDRTLAPNPEPRRIEGIKVRQWRQAEPAVELERIHALSLAAFAGNNFYQPISLAEFARLYQPVVPLIDPGLVLFAETEAGECIGFLFALPDRLEGAAPKTAILKTYASRRRGVGGLLGDHFYAIVRERGYQAVVHALVHVDNLSLKRSQSRHGEAFRRYALFGRSLAT